MDAVGAVKYAFAPGAKQISVGVEHRYRVLAAIEGIDPVLPIDANRRTVTQGNFLRHLRPILVDLEPVFAASKLNRHASSPPFALLQAKFILDTETQIRRALHAPHYL